MAYQVPPVFNSGDVLSAANLNIISQNLEFFWSLVSGVNIPFSGQTMTGSGSSRVWTFRHTCRYLHYKFFLDGGDSDEITLVVNGNDEWGDATNRSADYTWTGYVDTNAITSPPAIGSFYDCHVDMSFGGGGGSDLQIVYLIESDSTSL